MNKFAKRISEALNLAERGVDNTLQLLDEGCTIPFISRYRKERTGGLDEVQITSISELNDKLKEIEKRKETIIKTITEQGHGRTGRHLPSIQAQTPHTRTSSKRAWARASRYYNNATK